MPESATDAGESDNLIRAEGVTKRFGALSAVDGVSYRVRRNEIAGIFGSNGAGKTTFFNLLTGYFVPDAGRIWYKGRDITHASAEERVAAGMSRSATGKCAT
jgi:branched-chain amino acid transport system ATP-binding protein